MNITKLQHTIDFKSTALIIHDKVTLLRIFLQFQKKHVRYTLIIYLSPNEFLLMV